ncbi:MAG: zinc-ribbon domain-containing protein [Nanoarchaeota archaeon]
MNSMLECPLCGAEIGAKESYCPECGETLKKD